MHITEAFSYTLNSSKTEFLIIGLKKATFY